jgi:CubicO group peptidase (beta-lactamase class C family)
MSEMTVLHQRFGHLLLALSMLATGPVTAKETQQPVRISLTVQKQGGIISKVSGERTPNGARVSRDDPLRIASVSKLVTGLAVMRLVDQGKIDLDRDISAYLGWQVRNPAFPGTPVTMRLLLSHQSSVTDAADYILGLDGDLETLLQNPDVWDKKHAPGTWFSYANLNFPLVAAVMESAAGMRFDHIMDREVFVPLKLDACFNWQTSCSKNRRQRAVTLRRPNGDIAKDPPLKRGEAECNFVRARDGGCDIGVYKLGRNGSAFSPQGGLRISAGDLVTIGKVLRDGGKPILSQRAFGEMIRPAWLFNGSNGDDLDGAFQSFGLSIDIQNDSKGARWIGHVGDAYSLRSGLWVNMETQEIRVKIATMVDEFSPVGSCLEVCP